MAGNCAQVGKTGYEAQPSKSADNSGKGAPSATNGGVVQSIKDGYNSLTGANRETKCEALGCIHQGTGEATAVRSNTGDHMQHAVNDMYSKTVVPIWNAGHSVARWWKELTIFGLAGSIESGPAILAKTAEVAEIGTIFTRTTKNATRLGGESGEFGVKIVYKNGTEFDMTLTRVKQTELNPYVPGATRPIKFENAVNKQGTKRAPTAEELQWFLSITW